MEESLNDDQCFKTDIGCSFILQKHITLWPKFFDNEGTKFTIIWEFISYGEFKKSGGLFGLELIKAVI